jgi:hypothetical protein
VVSGEVGERGVGDGELDEEGAAVGCGGEQVSSFEELEGG